MVLGVSSRALGYESSVLYGRALTKRWLATGEWLKKAARPGDLVATPVAGAIPYASGLPSIDMLGLNDRVIARRRVKLGGAEKDHEKYDAAYVLSRNPAWIYIGPFEAESIGDARRRASGLSVYRDLFRQLPSEGWELASGRYRGAGFSFLRRVP